MGDEKMVSDEIFKLRRKVMKHLYRARELGGTCVPWLKVRVIPLKGGTLGQAHINKNRIDISTKMAKWNDNKIKNVVFHELGHEYYKASHLKDKKNLMYPQYHKMSDSKIESDFKKIAKIKICKVK